MAALGFGLTGAGQRVLGRVAAVQGRVIASVIGTGIGLLSVVPAAEAHARCGGSYRHACAIRKNETVHGSLPISRAHLASWYRLRLRPHTRLKVTLKDRENVSCAICAYGSAQLDLFNSVGVARHAQLRQTATVSRDGASAVLRASPHAAGTYYIDVNGYTNGEPLSFSLTVHASPRPRR